MRMRYLLQGLAGLREEWYTEEDTDVEVERVPLSLSEESGRQRIQRLLREAAPSAPAEKTDVRSGFSAADGKEA